MRRRVCSEGFQDAQPVGGGTTGHVGAERVGVELVGDARVQVEFDGHPGLAQPQRIGQVLVAEDVQLPDLEVGGRQAGQVGRRASYRATLPVIMPPPCR